MRSYRIFFSVIVCLGLIMMSCGVGGSDNPVGVTGGAMDGYGVNSIVEGSAQDSDASGQTGDFVGTWVGSMDIMTPYGFPIEATITLTINADGTYEMTYEALGASETETGTYLITGDQLFIDGELANYTLTGNTLILYLEGETLELTRVNV
ncbi:hypothetical protein JW835_02160 [bacterium]|nr:hypothetical protein [bacterium]